MNNKIHPNVKRVIDVANELISTGKTGASTGERIAAAFVLDRMDFLPEGYTVVQAWDRLDTWQRIVRKIQADYTDLLAPW